ncbi:MAG TPA: GNAT family N-acetyltransferase [Bacteroidia bacterium]|nr:GNAT family N-acetyltransferase [Bacteroidia bacterium]
MLQFQFTPFPVLTTKRLVLRRIAMSDKAAIFKMRSNPSLMNFIARPVATTDQEAHDLIVRVDAGVDSNISINWAITLQGNDTLIGMCGFVRATPEHHRAEVGYMLDSAFHNQGIMSESLEAVLKYGFDVMGLHLAEAVIDPRNKASGKVLEKLGFVQEAYFHENYFYRDEFLDSVHFALLQRNFQGLQSPAL